MSRENESANENVGDTKRKRLTLDEFLEALLTRKMKPPIAAEAFVDAVLDATFEEMCRFRVDLAMKAPESKKALNRYITLVVTLACGHKEFNVKIQEFAEWSRAQSSTKI